MKKPVLAMFLLVLIVGLVAGACGGGDDKPTATPRPAATNTPTAEVTQPPSDSPTPTGGGEGIPISVINRTNPYVFEPNEFDFKVGTTYTLTIEGQDEFHSFTVDDLGIDISIDAGETVVFEFTPTQTGTFKLICIPHQALGMVGEVRVS